MAITMLLHLPRLIGHGKEARIKNGPATSPCSTSDKRRERQVARRIKNGSVEPYSPIMGIRRITWLDAEGAALMLDHPEKTARLLAALKAAAPFDVELPPSLIEHLQTEDVVNVNQTRHVVWDLSYAGDEGGIMCHMSRSDETGKALVISLTYIRVSRSMPLARAVADYQKHRVKKLKKQSYN
jgi:hypothetical protein